MKQLSVSVDPITREPESSFPDIPTCLPMFLVHIHWAWCRIAEFHLEINRQGWSMQPDMYNVHWQRCKYMCTIHAVYEYMWGVDTFCALVYMCMCHMWGEICNCLLTPTDNDGINIAMYEVRSCFKTKKQQLLKYLYTMQYFSLFLICQQDRSLVLGLLVRSEIVNNLETCKTNLLFNCLITIQMSAYLNCKMIDVLKSCYLRKEQ